MLRGAETELSGPSRGLHWPGQPLGRAHIKPVPGLDAPPSAEPREATPKVRGAQDRGFRHGIAVKERASEGGAENVQFKY